MSQPEGLAALYSAPSEYIDGCMLVVAFGAARNRTVLFKSRLPGNF